MGDDVDDDAVEDIFEAGSGCLSYYTNFMNKLSAALRIHRGVTYF